MRKIIKVITVTTFITIFSINLSPTSNAAQNKKVPEVVCKKTSAKAHSIKNITPPEVKPPFKNKTFTLTTNCGDITIEAYGASAPIAVTTMLSLARNGFFNETLCHRLTTNESYLLHCGDPTATGMGQLSFEYDNENLPKSIENNYPAGTVGIWNSEEISNGSQFFIVYEDSSLPPSYTIWGKVTKGLDIVRAIAKDGVVNGTILSSLSIAIR
ncbi:MAG: peptidylprolyl isomerase [Actinobacteria bacterium]|nr:peptidylprolyl isomerase [Actinomycetota bacterium]